MSSIRRKKAMKLIFARSPIFIAVFPSFLIEIDSWNFRSLQSEKNQNCCQSSQIFLLGKIVGIGRKYRIPSLPYTALIKFHQRDYGKLIFLTLNIICFFYRSTCCFFIGVLDMSYIFVYSLSSVQNHFLLNTIYLNKYQEQYISTIQFCRNP